VKANQIGDNRLIARLGRGRVTEVYLGVRSPEPGKTSLAVVKRLRAPLAPARVREASLRGDAQFGVRLRHPHIVSTHEVSFGPGLPFWTTEYVDGQPLDRVLAAVEQSGGLPVADTVRVVSAVLSALVYARDRADGAGTSAGDVHGDVGPHNVFVSHRGEVKLADFGVSKLVRASASAQEGGDTAMDLASERAEEEDRSADLYAVGLLLWECLAQQRPPDSASGAAPARLASLQPSLDRSLIDICERALERRYDSAGALLADLEKLAAADGGELPSLMEAHFGEERAQRERRIQELLAVNGITLGESAAPAFGVGAAPPMAASLAGLGASPPWPQPSAAGEAAPPTATTLTGLGATRLAAAGPLDGPTSRSLPPPLPDSVPPAPLALPHSEASPSARPPKPTARRALAIAALLLALIALAGTLTWTRWRTPPPQATASLPLTAAVVEAPEAELVVRLCGSNTVGAELAPALLEALFAKKGGARVLRQRRRGDELESVVASYDGKQIGGEISAKGSATAFAGLADGTCDIGMASRAIDDAEVAALAARGFGDMRAPAAEHVIALDGVAVIVHPNNPLSSLDRAALHEVFTGRVEDWSQIGGAPGKINVLARDAKSGTFDTFQHLVLAKAPLAASAKRFPHSAALADAVSSDPSAIGFVGFAYVRVAKALAVGEPGATQLLPTRFTVATEGYMLSRRLYLYTLPTPRTPWVTELVNFALSRAGQEVVSKTQFVDLVLVARPVPCDETCTPGYAAAIAHAQRVSVDFRFQSGSDRPDSRARRDFDRLVSFLAEAPNAKLMLLGFSDAVGSASANRKLSVERAKAVAQELSARGVRVAQLEGFGAEMPLATNQTDSGRERNRRVEVWLQQ
jgi:phosphate transport system substrate-binding protein